MAMGIAATFGVNEAIAGHTNTTPFSGTSGHCNGADSCWWSHSNSAPILGHCSGTI